MIKPAPQNSLIDFFPEPTPSTSPATSDAAPGTILPPSATPSQPSNANDNVGANLSRTQTAALIAAPLGSILVAVMVYMLWWRRRRSPPQHSVESTPLQRQPPMDEFRGSEPPTMAAPGSPPSLARVSSATTEILMGVYRDRGPLRSHPVTISESDLQSGSHRNSDSFQSVDATQGGSGSSSSSGGGGGGRDSGSGGNEDDEDGSSGDAEQAHEETVLAPFGNEFIHGSVRYSSTPMRYVTRLDEPDLHRGSSEAVIETGPRLPTPKERRQSWNPARWSRRKDSEMFPKRHSATRPGSDWITPIDWENAGPREKRQTWQWDMATAGEEDERFGSQRRS